MIKINNVDYTTKNVNISFGNYYVSQCGKKITGISPFIQFEVNNNILVGIETVYDKEWLQEMPINNKKNITEYISDITYEDEKGWLSLITGTYTCFLEKIGQCEFNLELSCNAEECDDNFDILINEHIIIDL